MEVITGIAWENTFYEINVPENSEELLIELQFSHIGGDLDLSLYDSDNNLIGSSDSTTDNESISISSPASGTYSVAVQPYEVTGNTYELRWDIGDGGGNSGGERSVLIACALIIPQNQLILYFSTVIWVNP